ncbi:type I-E CRISPR-associated protein Cse1/CasA [Streptomyces sp. NPDC007084]|uniref:type I-E CRISPR-associated protein Cse1/CasA n=1 Tax=Streptomyces sp. NPDC007084 TaxID=3154313 RepID=UPI003453A0B2
MPARSHSTAEAPLFPVIWTPDAQAGSSNPLPPMLGFRELLLRSHEIIGLAVAEPPAHSALLRILYALTARITGLDESGPGDWGDRRLDVVDAGSLPADGINAYFARWGHRFFVFDPEGGRPWMQDPRLAEQCDAGNTAGVNKLIVTRPAGNNHSWFTHASDLAPTLPTVSDAVLNLLVWHFYGPSGRCSAREVGGVKTASATAGPLRTALSYHPEGENLFQTLLAGLTPPETTVRRAVDLCPWEWEQLPDPDVLPNDRSGPMALLTACSSHALLLVRDEDQPDVVADAYITWAYRGGRIPRDDAYLIWQISQEGNRYPRPADSKRALWRDVDALLLYETGGPAQPRRPRVFNTAFDVAETLRVRALGFEQEGQAKDRQFVEGSTPPLLGRVESHAPRTEAAVAWLRRLGELYGRRLDRAVRKAWSLYVNDLKAEHSTWSAEAGARYWPQAETEFWTRYRLLDRTAAVLDAGLDRASTRKAFLTFAERSFEEVTSPVASNARGARALAQARVELYGGQRPKKDGRGQTAGSAPHLIPPDRHGGVSA